MMRKIQILHAIPNIKVPSHDKYVIYIDFSILEILQSQLKKVWININQEIRQPMIEKENAENIPMVKYVLLKKKPKRRHSNVDVGYDSRWVTYICRISGECYLVRMVKYFYQFFFFFIHWTWYRVYWGLRWFLNEYDVIQIMSFKYGINDKIVLVNILRENFNVL